MTTKDNVNWDSLEYAVISIKKVAPPNNNFLDEQWFKYIVGRSNNCVKGIRQGTLSEVTKHAESIAEDLNSRRDLKTGPLWRTRKPPT